MMIDPFVIKITQLYNARPKAINSMKSATLSIMTIPYSDTDSRAERVQLELLRHAPVWRKIQMVAHLNETVRTLALSGLSQRHPNASSQQLQRLLADLVLGESLAEKVYGPATDNRSQR